METNVEIATKAYVQSVRHTSDLRNKLAEIVSKADRKFGHDEDLRRSEMKKVQRAFYRVILADQLREDPKFWNLPEHDLLAEADSILGKKGYMKGRNAAREGRRTAVEHRQYGALRVRWNELSKSAGIAAIDSRGG
jgi:hypothetical protein